ncbi:hypothetical protein GB928_025000 [Shinella curvata]|uniref:Uncharacterized protein n=1 Tax=Shinella curvata TaxID=1817964 RepID=A0ABT8XL85_9HYPH|nr:hypothetical protein [Shinella curvata]MCJ8056703.1 hypothetical protein [Shinella curvata]MDO6124457.1 hypothetical protein [Shinella curvata]
MPKSEKNTSELLKIWTLTADATMGSSVRAKGILQEIQARLPKASKKAVSVEGVDLVLVMPIHDRAAFNAAVSVVSKAIADAPALPVIPREIQDILGMKASERHRWLADGRLPSAGTRTVRLAGRARKITFHVFDPKVVEDLLNRGAADEWRVEEAEAKAEKKRNATLRAKLVRLAKRKKSSPNTVDACDEAASRLRGWGDFDVDGLLR